MSKKSKNNAATKSDGSLLEAAQGYAKLGLKIFPLPAKCPLSKEARGTSMRQMT